MTLREYINSLPDNEFLRFLFPKSFPYPCNLCQCHTDTGCIYDDLEFDMYDANPFDCICQRELLDSLRQTLDLTTINSRK